MSKINSTIVNSSAEHVWDIIGNQFVDVAAWLAATPTSDEITTGTPLKGAPAVGRNSYLPKKFNGMYQRETITMYNDAKRSLTYNVELKNTPKIMPLKGYDSTVTVEPISSSTCRVTWDHTANLRALGYIIPGIKNSMKPGFIRTLEEIKHFAETGEPHPRKIKINKENAAAA